MNEQSIAVDEPQIARRRVLQGAGLAAGGVLATGAGYSALESSDSGRGNRVDGSWLVDVTDDTDDAVTVAVISFAAGNVFIAKDISPPGPPGIRHLAERSSHQGNVLARIPGRGGPRVARERSGDLVGGTRPKGAALRHLRSEGVRS